MASRREVVGNRWRRRYAASWRRAEHGGQRRPSLTHARLAGRLPAFEDMPRHFVTGIIALSLASVSRPTRPAAPLVAVNGRTSRRSSCRLAATVGCSERTDTYDVVEHQPLRWSLTLDECWSGDTGNRHIRDGSWLNGVVYHVSAEEDAGLLRYDE